MILGAFCEDFSSVYPHIVRGIEETGKVVSSRNGSCKELLNFHTEITCPYKRLVGGNMRKMNAFFLIAEAIWIAAGHNDVAFLSLFNSGMEKYSDDGKVFHAPYGFRLRKYGLRSEEADDALAQGSIDQVATVIRMLWKNSDDRRAVMSIWDVKQDLAVDSKDIPCNDMIMIKVRDGKMYTTICNRSNDIHWGLPTNVFQFSFLTEMMAGCLGLELGTQTHLSQSLHLYSWHDKVTEEMRKCDFSDNTLYDRMRSKYHKIDFNFESDVPTIRYVELSNHLNDIIDMVKRASSGEEIDEVSLDRLMKFSKILYAYACLLLIYVEYKRSGTPSDDTRNKALSDIEALMMFLDSSGLNVDNWDVYNMCASFFLRNLNDTSAYDQDMVKKLTTL